MSFCFKSFYVIKKFIINNVELSTLDPKNTSYTFNNNGIQH
jgi:hypothetical protein